MSTTSNQSISHAARRERRKQIVVRYRAIHTANVAADIARLAKEFCLTTATVRAAIIGAGVRLGRANNVTTFKATTLKILADFLRLKNQSEVARRNGCTVANVNQIVASARKAGLLRVLKATAGIVSVSKN